jgi:hypothetical protein
VASFEGNNLVVFYYLSESEFCPYKRGDPNCKIMRNEIIVLK